jgi:hypothetical protein
MNRCPRKASVSTSKIGCINGRKDQRGHGARIVGTGLAEVGRDQGGAEWSGDGGLAGAGIVPVDKYETNVCIAIDAIKLAVLDLYDDGGL